MSLLAVFAVTLLVAALLSNLASRSVLSTSVLFLGVGLLLAFTDATGLDAESETLVTVIEVTLFAVLYTDSMRVGVGDLRTAWRLPGRALLLGMPLIFATTAVLGRYLVGLDWLEAMLVAAVIAPTDPVLVSALTGREPVPDRLRFLLGVESGLNDGMALPVVLLLLASLRGAEAEVGAVLSGIGLGVALGVAIPVAVLWVIRFRVISAVGTYERILGVAIGLVVFVAAALVGANEFLAAFAAGVSIRSMNKEFAEGFEYLGGLLSELLKLFGLLIFAAAIEPEILLSLPATAWIFAVLALVAARPLSMLAALLASELGLAERITVGWFGPKGFASVFLGLIVFQSEIENASTLFALITLVVGLSVIVHSSTDILAARYFGRRAEQEEREEDAEQPDREAVSPDEKTGPPGG